MSRCCKVYGANLNKIAHVRWPENQDVHAFVLLWSWNKVSPSLQFPVHPICFFDSLFRITFQFTFVTRLIIFIYPGVHFISVIKCHISFKTTWSFRSFSRGMGDYNGFGKRFYVKVNINDLTCSYKHTYKNISVLFCLGAHRCTHMSFIISKFP